MSDTSAKQNSAAIVGVGAAACAACCAGPILGFLGAFGLGTIAGVFLFGVAGLAVVALAIGFFTVRRRRRNTACAPGPEIVPVEMPTITRR